MKAAKELTLLAEKLEKSGVAAEIVEQIDKRAEYLIEISVFDGMTTADVLDVLQQSLPGIKTSVSEIKPKLWHKLVAKIPGVCKFNSMHAGKIKEELKKAEVLLKKIKQAEQAGDASLVDSLARQAMDLYDPEPDNKGKERDWQKNKKKYIEWIKAGQMIADYRGAEKKTEGLGAACKSKKK